MAKVVLKNVRLSFPVLFTAEEFEKGDGKPRYGCALLIRKDDPQIAKVKAAILEAGVEKFGNKFKDKAFRSGVKMHGFRNGDEQEYDGYKGCMFVSANRAASRGAPKIIDWDKSELRETDGRPYAGCYVNASVDFYGDSRYGKAVNAGLVAVQFARHGEAFAGGSRFDEDDFEELEPPEGLEEDEEVGAETEVNDATDWQDELLS